MPRVAYVVTVDLSMKLIEGQIGFLARNGYEIDVICSPGSRLEAMRQERVRPWPVKIEREISVAHDIVSLGRLWRLFRRIRPDIVVAGTPKAGLLGTLAARLAAVRHVQYALFGLRFETTGGMKRRILMGAEWIACHVADSVRCVSPSVMARAIALSLAPAARCTVVGKGTSDGIAIERYAPTAQTESRAKQLRLQYGIPTDAPVLGYVGRITRDKGIRELFLAFKRLQNSYPALRLLLVGDHDATDPIPAALRAQIESDPAIIRTGFVEDVERFYGMMDAMALPTYREGFSTVLVEAQCASVPVVTTNVTGAIDAIVDGETGLRVAARDTDELTAALDRLLGDKALRCKMGKAGRDWVEKNFRQEDMWQGILAHYQLILKFPHDKTIKRWDGRKPAIIDAKEYRQSSMFKNIFDRVLAAIALLVLSPMMLAVAALTWWRLGRPILYRPIRTGLHGQPFSCLKFRTMTNAVDDSGAPLPDAQRLTLYGRILRSTSLDELPQLWNVVRGEMSLVGPRPLLLEYLPRYSPHQRRRHEVKPGITGWAQVNGRNGLTWEEKFNLDVWYVDHRSAWLDCKILFMTLMKIIDREGISQPGHATMPEFIIERPVGESHE
jgi:lipopolysaccharide/colanic/teichoic acid biosynthesis glycosyltransferase/glycosyltransferase involved in cell wall biosynthesis